MGNTCIKLVMKFIYVLMRCNWSSGFNLILAPFGLVCAVLVNIDILTANYSVKQSQFTKSTSEPRASDSEESNEAFNRAIRGWLL